MPKDYYAVLGVPRVADRAAIHSAFRSLARKYHPDVGQDSSSAKFREALEAYHTLIDPSSRRQHDIELAAPTRPRPAVAEPLFEFPRSRMPVGTTVAPAWDDLVADLLRLIEIEFDLLLPFRTPFF